MAYVDLATQSAGQTASAAGWANVVKANFAAMPPHLHHVLLSDQAVTTTPTAVTGFSVPVLGTEQWWLWIHTVVVCPSGNWNMRFTFPAGGSITANYAGFSGSATYGNTLQLTSTSPTGSATHIGNTVGQAYMAFVSYKNGGTGGNVVMEANGTTTTVTIKGGHSHLWIAKIA